MGKIYYHVVMKGSKWIIVESIHRSCDMVKYSVNSYVYRKHAEDNIGNPNSRHYGVVKKFW